MAGNTLTRKAKELYAIGKGQLGLRFPGELRYRLVGNMESFAITQDATITDFTTNEDSDGTPAFSDVTGVALTGNFVVRNGGNLIDEIRYLALASTLTQLAAQDIEFDIPLGVEFDDTYNLRAKNTTIQSIKAGAIEFELGVHYVEYGEKGKFIITAIPDGYVKGTPVKVIHDQAAYTGKRYEALSRGSFIDVELIYMATNDNGPRPEIEIHKASITTDGAQNKVSDADLTTSGFKFTIYKHPTKGYYTVD